MGNEQQSDAQEQETVLSTTYVLTDEPAKDITVSLTIGGDGQKGRSTIRVGDRLDTVEGSVSNFRLGTNDELDGEMVYIETVVVDVAPGHNHATLTAHLKGGATNVKYPLGKIVEEGGTATFSIEFLFIKF